MSNVTFDTLKLSRRLKAGGFTHEQATTMAEALNETFGDELVTRGYLDVCLEALEDRITGTILKWMFAALLGQAALIAALVKLT